MEDYEKRFNRIGKICLGSVTDSPIETDGSILKSLLKDNAENVPVNFPDPVNFSENHSYSERPGYIPRHGFMMFSREISRENDEDERRSSLSHRIWRGIRDAVRMNRFTPSGYTSEYLVSVGIVLGEVNRILLSTNIYSEEDIARAVIYIEEFIDREFSRYNEELKNLCARELRIA